VKEKNFKERFDPLVTEALSDFNVEFKRLVSLRK